MVVHEQSERRSSSRLVVFNPAGVPVQKGEPRLIPARPSWKPALLPEPVFPLHPEKCGDVAPDPESVPRNGSPYRTRVTPFVIRRAARGWLYPYLRSRVYPGDFHPMIAYLFTEWKCNLDCHYCWAFDNRAKGMTEDTAGRAIDWLHDTGCRVLALMGGEVLLRPDFAHKVVYYAAKRGFWVYVPTNGRLLRQDVIDWLIDKNRSGCYDAGRAFKWVVKPALRGFQGTTGSFEQ